MAERSYFARLNMDDMASSIDSLDTTDEQVGDFPVWGNA